MVATVPAALATVALLGLFAASAGESVELDAYGIRIESRTEGLVITAIAADSPAEREGLRVGARVVRVNAIPVESIAQVRRLVGAGPVDLTVEGPEETGGPRRALHRVSALAVGHALTGQDESLSAYLGLAYGVQALPRLWLIASLGYVPVGKKPFVDGRNATSILGGAELEVALDDDLWFGFVRALGGATIPWGGRRVLVFGPVAPRWTIETLTVFGHVGARAAGFEFFLAGGHGPAEGVNLGLGFAFELTFGER